MILHELHYFHHLSKIVSHILLVVDTEKAMCHIIMYLLFVLLESLYQIVQSLDLGRGFAVLAQLRLECLQGGAQMVKPVEVEIDVVLNIKII